jgi:hypothetical protein
MINRHARILGSTLTAEEVDMIHSEAVVKRIFHARVDVKEKHILGASVVGRR